MKFIKIKGRIELHGNGSYLDYMAINNCDRLLLELDDEDRGGKGANSAVFQAIDPNETEEDLVIKFCRYYLPGGNYYNRKRIERFEREISALKNVRDSEHKDSVVKIIDDGEHAIDGNVFRYYVMEKANYDLKKYLSENELILQQKTLLFRKLSQSLKSLHDMGIYHRDLKPDNIFCFNGDWKIGDLGLIAFRKADTDIDSKCEWIGPRGFLSPEAENKALGDRDRSDFDFDVRIDDKSDVFQLGKIYWYILQGEIPSGHLTEDDIKEDVDGMLKPLLLSMLQYKKTRRPNIHDIEPLFNDIYTRLAV